MELIKKPLDKATRVIYRDKLSFYSIGKYNHKEICYYNTIKYREFNDDIQYFLCNSNLLSVLICPISKIKSFTELSKDLLSYYQIDEEKSQNLGIYSQIFQNMKSQSK